MSTWNEKHTDKNILDFKKLTETAYGIVPDHHDTTDPDFWNEVYRDFYYTMKGWMNDNDLDGELYKSKFLGFCKHFADNYFTEE